MIAAALLLLAAWLAVRGVARARAARRRDDMQLPPHWRPVRGTVMITDFYMEGRR